MSDRVGLPDSIPNKYVGPSSNLVPLERFPRRPTTTDKKYPVGQFVILGINPSTGVQGELWYLKSFVAGVPQWVQLATGASSPGIDFIETDDGPTAVGPDGSGIVKVLGGTGIVTSGQDPSTTVSVAVDTSVIATQYDADTGTATPTSGVLNIVGGAGIVTSAASDTVTIALTGGTGAIDSIGVDASSGGGTDPVLPDANGLMTVNGAAVAAHSVPVETHSRSANTYNVEVQVASDRTGAPANTNDAGLVSFDDTQFITDANGYTTLVGGGVGNTSTFISRVTSDISNVTGDGTAYNVVFDTADVNIGSDYDSTTGAYTAPVDGYYQFTFSCLIGGITASHTTGKGLFTKNGTEVGAAFRGDFAQISDAGNNLAFSMSALIKLDATDVVRCELTINNGTKVVDVLAGGGQSLSTFQGIIIREI